MSVKKTIMERDTGLREGKSYKAYLEEAKRKEPGLYGNYTETGGVNCNLGEGVTTRNN